MAKKKTYSLTTFLDEKYGMRTYTFRSKLTKEQKKDWEEIHGRSKILTPKSIKFIYQILGEPMED